MRRRAVPRSRRGATAPPARARGRRGSALVLVLIMTLSMAGLAISAVLLTSSSSLVQRFYDKDKDFRLFARAAIARVKSAVQRDTAVTIPGDSAYRALTGATITDANGATNNTIKVNGYAAYTADTAGTFIPFLTVIAQAYDTLGTRSVQRLDLQSESFSRYAFFVDTFLPNTSLDAGLHVRGRTHGNRNWVSAGTPGTYYYDTLSVSGSSIGGTSTFTGTTSVTSAKRIGWPTSATLARLPTLASAGNLSFVQAGTYTTLEARSGTNVINVSGENVAGSSAYAATRLSFRPVDVNANGVYDSDEGFFQVFDLAVGMDTANLRVDPVAATSENTRLYNAGSLGFTGNPLVLAQCGLLIRTASGRREFFPAGRFRELWVRAYVRNNSVAPAVSAADTATMAGFTVNTGDTIPSNAAVEKILGYGVGYSRCFPAGSPYLMLMERFVDAACAIDSTVLNTPWAWGATAAGCGVATQYGGQDTTFTPNTRRCWVTGSAGKCSGVAGLTGQVRLGSWRAFGGTSTANPPATIRQAVEVPYLWPIATTYNSASRGVIHASGTPVLFVSDTLRGFATLYAGGRVVLIDDLVYDRDPTASDALCRNMLGIVADTNIKVASSALNFYRRPASGGSYIFLGTPHFNLHAIALALSTTTSTSSSSNIRRHGVVGVEDSSTAVNASTVISCNGTNTFGGCFNHTGGAIMKVFHRTYGSANSGLMRNVTHDPCQDQATNRRPPFFPLTGRYVDYKWSEVDPRNAGTWVQIKAYVARLRGSGRAVP